MRLPRIPKLPKNFWRKLLSIVTEEPSRLYMTIWHGKWTSVGGSLVHMNASRLIRCKDDGCTTTHCMAGWATFLTRGGLRLEVELSRMGSGDLYRLAERHGVDLYLGDGTTACAAYLLLHKAGWSKHIMQSDFFSDNETALEKIKHLAKVEARRERDARRRASA